MLEFLFWFIVILVVIRLAARYLLPIFLQRQMKRFQKQFEDMQKDANQANKREGDVSIDYIPPTEEKAQQFDDSSAETIEFEDIKEN